MKRLKSKVPCVLRSPNCFRKAVSLRVVPCLLDKCEVYLASVFGEEVGRILGNRFPKESFAEDGLGQLINVRLGLLVKGFDLVSGIEGGFTRDPEGNFARMNGQCRRLPVLYVVVVFEPLLGWRGHPLHLIARPRPMRPDLCSSVASDPCFHR